MYFVYLQKDLKSLFKKTLENKGEIGKRKQKKRNKKKGKPASHLARLAPPSHPAQLGPACGPGRAGAPSLPSLCLDDERAPAFLSLTADPAAPVLLLRFVSAVDTSTDPELDFQIPKILGFLALLRHIRPQAPHRIPPLRPSCETEP